MLVARENRNRANVKTMNGVSRTSGRKFAHGEEIKRRSKEKQRRYAKQTGKGRRKRK